MSKLTFIIDGQSADVSSDIEFTRVYRGSDTTDENKNNYSFTVKFPFTYNNQKIFLRSNSLSYKSDFPYQTHDVNVLSNAVTLISKGKLTLLSTTDGFECAITWDNFDIIGELMNNPTKLGELLPDFEHLDWNYNWLSTMLTNYTTTKANEYGYIYYRSKGDEQNGTNSTYFFAFHHPLVNYWYLLELVFTALGITVNVPTLKSDFLFDLIIRPPKRLCNRTNKDSKFYCRTDVNSEWGTNVGVQMIDYIREDIFTTPQYGNNGYFFKSYIKNHLGDDGEAVMNGLDFVPSHLRIKCYEDCNVTLNISEYVASIGAPYNDTTLVRRRAGVYTDLFSFTGTDTYTFDALADDWYFFKKEKLDPVSSDVIDITYKAEFIVNNASDEFATNENIFPSLYHIPTGLDMTVGQLITEALKLTGAELSYDVNTGEFSFIDLTETTSTAYDITKNVISIQEITYDPKYIYAKLGQNNHFKYLSTSPVNGDHNETVVNEKLQVDKTQVQSIFSTSSANSFGGIVLENTDLDWFKVFDEKPLHLFYKNDVSNIVGYSSAINWSVMFGLFYEDWFNDLLELILVSTIRVVKLNAEITDVEFKRINTKGIVYISTYGKYYSMIEIIKNGDKAEFLLLELF